MLFDRQTLRSSSETDVIGDPVTQGDAPQPVALGAGNEFEEIVRLHSSRIFNFVFQMTRQRQDAEDLVQQTFIKAYHNLHRFDGSRPIINWLLTIARRSALNHFRSAKKWEEMPDSV